MDDQLRESLTTNYQMVGMLVIGIGMPREDPGLIGMGTQMVNRSDAVADAWLELAEKNPKVKAALRRFSEGSAAATLIGVHLSMAAPLLASRGIVPEGLAALLMTEPTMPDVSPNGNGDD